MKGSKSRFFLNEKNDFFFVKEKWKEIFKKCVDPVFVYWLKLENTTQQKQVHSQANVFTNLENISGHFAEHSPLSVISSEKIDQTHKIWFLLWRQIVNGALLGMDRSRQ